MTLIEQLQNAGFVATVHKNIESGILGGTHTTDIKDVGIAYVNPFTVIQQGPSSFKIYLLHKSQSPIEREATSEAEVLAIIKEAYESV